MSIGSMDCHLIFQSKDKIVAPVVFSDANFGFVLLGDDGAAGGAVDHNLESRDDDAL